MYTYTHTHTHVHIHTHTHTHTQVHTTKLIVVRNSDNAPKSLLIFTQIFNNAHPDGRTV